MSVHLSVLYTTAVENPLLVIIQQRSKFEFQVTGVARRRSSRTYPAKGKPIVTQKHQKETIEIDLSDLKEQDECIETPNLEDEMR